MTYHDGLRWRGVGCRHLGGDVSRCAVPNGISHPCPVPRRHAARGFGGAGRFLGAGWLLGAGGFCLVGSFLADW